MLQCYLIFTLFIYICLWLSVPRLCLSLICRYKPDLIRRWQDTNRLQTWWGWGLSLQTHRSFLPRGGLAITGNLRSLNQSFPTEPVPNNTFCLTPYFSSTIFLSVSPQVRCWLSCALRKPQHAPRQKLENTCFLSYQADPNKHLFLSIHSQKSSTDPGWEWMDR